MKETARRNFIKTSALGSVKFAFPISAKSCKNIIGENDRIYIGVTGINNKGRAHVRAAGLYRKDIQISALSSLKLSL